MAQEYWDYINALIILARFVQVFGFFFAIFMLIREFPLGYTFGVFSVNLVGFFGILAGVLSGKLSLVGVLLADLLIILLSLLLFIRGYKLKKEKEKYPPPPPPNTRCPVCGAYIKPNSSYCVIKDSKSLLYFDSRAHMEAFLKEPYAYRISKEINYDGVRKLCVDKREGWIDFEDYKKGAQDPQATTL